ncbi:MAG: hypothetical protein ACFFCV_16070 [Promethearchaeota archaeon]
MKKYKIPKHLNNKMKIFGILVISLLLFINFASISRLNFKETYPNSKNNPKMSWFWATLELTNPSEVHNKRFYRNSIISIKGHLYNKIDGSNKSGVNVAIQVNDITDMGYTDITDSLGRFNIFYTIDPLLDIYSSHKIDVIVTDSEPGGPGSEIEYLDFYTIEVNATSYFNIASHDDVSIPKLTEEDFNFNGFLYYDNGNGIGSVSVNYYWLAGSIIISQGSFLTDSSGALLTSLQIPITVVSYLTLKFNYSNAPYVNYSEVSITNIKVFSDVAWDLNINYLATVGDNYELTGTLFSLTVPSLRINDREIEILYNGSSKGTTTTASDGTFSHTFQINPPNGTASIQARLIHNVLGREINSSLKWIVIESAPTSTTEQFRWPPFLVFSIIFFPILGVIIAVLAVFGYRYYKKQEKESRVVHLPLESKIINLKILKDSGRIEESISYLFNAIYMDLINAKFNRTRNYNETIRDFAIISVKELKLTPASIYPFIQKVEEIIYARPFNISEKDFYNTCGLFSPIYFQLTGYNFVLNF